MQGTMVSVSGEVLGKTMHEIAKQAIQHIGSKPIEHFMVYFIGKQGACIGAELLATGTATEVAINLGLVLDEYMRYEALGMVAVHNHPNQAYAMPSMEDVQATAAWLDTGREIGFNMLDAFVVTSEDCCSIRSMFNGLAWPGEC
jgi:DNA repair protein RadC